MLASGYRLGGRVKGDAKTAVHAHERHLHKGEAETKLKDGGVAHGKRATHPKMARGGTVKPRKASTSVNVVVMPQGGGDQPQPMRQPVPVPVPIPGGPPRSPLAGAPPPMPPRPMPGGPPGGMPPGLMGAKNGGRMFKRGGTVKMDAGAGGGEGRLEKIKAYGAKRAKKTEV